MARKPFTLGKSFELRQIFEPGLWAGIHDRT